MPTDSEHLLKYQANRVVLDKLRADPEHLLEWISIVAFYCAVHLIEALAYHDEKRNSADHTERSRYLTKSNHAVLHQNLNALRTASETARYQSCRMFQAHFRASSVEYLVTYHLKTIEDYVLNVWNGGTSQAI